MQAFLQSPQFQLVSVILLVIIPWTFPAMGVIWRCVLWASAWVLLLHLAITQIPVLVRWPLTMKASVAIFLSSALVMATYFPIVMLWKKEKSQVTNGVLSAHSDGEDHTNDPPIIQIGHGGTSFVWRGTPGDPIFKWTADEFVLRRVGNEILFSTTVRDRLGNLIVEVVDNRWTVSSLKTSCWDKNYTDDSLEVKDGRGRVVLQVRILPDRIQLQGEWPGEGGQSNAIIEHGQYDSKTGIAPMFKYPSEQFWGERIR